MEKKTTKKQNRTLQSAVPRGRITELGRRAATAQLNDRRRRSSSPFSKSSRHRGHLVAINVSLRLPIGFGDDELSRTICISSRFGSMASTRSKSQRMKTKNAPSDVPPIAIYKIKQPIAATEICKSAKSPPSSRYANVCKSRKVAERPPSPQNRQPIKARPVCSFMQIADDTPPVPTRSKSAHPIEMRP